MANNKVLAELHYLISKHQLGALAKSEAEVLKKHAALLIHDLEQTFEAFEPAQPAPTPEQPVDPQPEPTVEPTPTPEVPAAPADEPKVDGEPQA